MIYTTANYFLLMKIKDFFLKKEIHNKQRAIDYTRNAISRKKSHIDFAQIIRLDKCMLIAQ